MRDVLLKSSNQLRGFPPNTNITSTFPEGTTLAKEERELAKQDIKVVEVQRPYLWYDPLLFRVPSSIPVVDQ